MLWKKIGLIFCPNNHYEWMLSHAANPVAEHLQDDLFRIYFSCRDNINRASIAYVDIDITDPLKIVNLAKTPVISHGLTGCFDDSGVSMGCIVQK